MKYQISMTKSNLSEAERRQRLSQLLAIFEQSSTEASCDPLGASRSLATDKNVLNIDQPVEIKSKRGSGIQQQLF